MPIFWRYLLQSYFKVFFLSICGFVSVLLVTRLKEIAQFASQASSYLSIISYTIFQIPHILPIAISISCFISSILLFQKLSQMSELTALRSCGISLKAVLTPLLFAAIFLSILNFYVISEVTSRCRIKSKEILFEQTSINPIVLLQRQKVSKIKNSYIEMKNTDSQHKSEDLIIIAPNKRNNRLNLINIPNLQLKNNQLLGENVTIISYMDSKQKNNFDNLIIENQSTMKTDASALSQFMKSKRWTMTPHSLPLRMVLIKAKLDKSKSRPFKSDHMEVEIIRRFAMALSAFSFTFIGASFGIQINSKRSKKGVLIASLLSLSILVSFLVGKSLKYYPIYSCITYIGPQVIVLIFTGFKLKKLSRGSS